MCSRLWGFTAKIESFSLEFNLHHYNHHELPKREEFLTLKLEVKQGKGGTAKRSRKCSWHWPQSFWWPNSVPSVRLQRHGCSSSVPKATAAAWAQERHYTPTNWFQSGFGVCFDGGGKTRVGEKPVVSQCFTPASGDVSPFTFLSGKGFKMQLNNQNILEQVSRQSFLSFCLMKAMSSWWQVSAGARWGLYEIPATFQWYCSMPLVCLPQPSYLTTSFPPGASH